MTADQIARIYTHASRADLNELVPHLIATAARYGINSPLRQAHWLAQVGHESGELRYREEIASGAAYEGRQDLGNTQPGDGRKFKGRGLIQLTGRANYTDYSDWLADKGAVLLDPSIIARDPQLCCDVAGWYWAGRALNRHADRDDLDTITLRINGGRNGIRDRQRLLTLAKAVLIDDAESRSTAALQRTLNQLQRAGLAVDGVLGPQTVQAIRVFQHRAGLKEDGIAGPQTWAALKQAQAEAA